MAETSENIDDVVQLYGDVDNEALEATRFSCRLLGAILPIQLSLRFAIEALVSPEQNAQQCWPSFAL